MHQQTDDNLKNRRNLIIASTSTLYHGGYLEYLLDELSLHFQNTDEILFIPYARPGGISHDDYTQKAAKAFEGIGKTLIGLHTFKNPSEAIQKAKGIFTGGGNTFVLLNALYKFDLIPLLRKRLFDGLPYLGTSAGSNICGVSINTTNDMPIIYPPSFKAIGALPFNINPHYLDPDPSSKHMGETRETRLQEFHSQSTIPVVGLREGSWIRVEGESFVLKGALTARIFEPGKEPYEILPNTDIKF